MRNCMCRFCLIRCDKINDQVWKCHHCGGEYHIELFEEPKFNYIVLDQIKVFEHQVTDSDEIVPTRYYKVIVDLMRDQTEIWYKDQKKLTLPYTIPFEHHCRTITEAKPLFSWNKEPKIFNRNYELSHWVEYQLQMQWRSDRGIPECKCLICGGYCINTTPKVSIYWECKECDVHYYFSETPPFKMDYAQFSFPKNNETYWRIVVDYKKNTTSVSYEEDKSEVEVLKLDSIPELNDKFNVRAWTQKIMNLMVFS